MISCTFLHWPAVTQIYIRVCCSVSRGSQSIQARQLVFQPVELVQGCFVFGNDAQPNANKGTEHPDERPFALLDTKNVLTKLLTLQTVSLYLTRAIGPLSSNDRRRCKIKVRKFLFNISWCFGVMKEKP